MRAQSDFTWLSLLDVRRRSWHIIVKSYVIYWVISAHTGYYNHKDPVPCTLLAFLNNTVNVMRVAVHPSASRHSIEFSMTSHQLVTFLSGCVFYQTLLAVFFFAADNRTRTHSHLDLNPHSNSNPHSPASQHRCSTITLLLYHYADAPPLRCCGGAEYLAIIAPQFWKLFVLVWHKWAGVRLWKAQHSVNVTASTLFYH